MRAMHHLFGHETLVVCRARLDLILELNHRVLPLLKLIVEILQSSRPAFTDISQYIQQQATANEARV